MTDRGWEAAGSDSDFALRDKNDESGDYESAEVVREASESDDSNGGYSHQPKMGQCVNCTAPHFGGPLDRCRNCQSRTPLLLPGADLTVLTAYKNPMKGRLQVPADALCRTGYAYDVRMTTHREIQSFGGGRNPPEHPERPNRVLSMWAHLNHLELLKCAIKIPPRLATRKELLGVHSAEHCDLVDSLGAVPEGIHFGGDTYACADSTVAARLSCAGVIDAAVAVISGLCENAVAVVRPPGHHAEESQVCGFCLYNNVAVAAQALLDGKFAKKILIVDWDVHHGNGIQNIFYDSPQVLYISLHRFGGGFFPGTGHAFQAGKGAGIGHNINIAWSDGGMGDAEYLLAFQRVIMPVARAFAPDVVLVSSGFDAARGDPLGGNDVTPHCYGQMTTMLRELAGGKVVVALEGGYNLRSICRSMENCVAALRLPRKLGSARYAVEPIATMTACETGQADIQRVLATHAQFWRNVLRSPRMGDGTPMTLSRSRVLSSAPYRASNLGHGFVSFRFVGSSCAAAKELNYHRAVSVARPPAP